MRRFMIATMLATQVATPAHATGMQDLGAIDRAVAEYTGHPIGQPGGAQNAVDRQLRLQGCDGPLVLEWFGASRQTLRVTCSDQGGWRLFVPIMAGSRSAAPSAPVVSRRDPLRVEAGGSGFRISRAGEALEDGHVGATIRVRMDDGTRAGRIISAEVIEAGRVRVALN